MWFMVCQWPPSQEGDWARPHLCRLARYGPLPVRKQFTRDGVWCWRWKPGCGIVGSVTTETVMRMDRYAWIKHDEVFELRCDLIAGFSDCHIQVQERLRAPTRRSIRGADDNWKQCLTSERRSISRQKTNFWAISFSKGNFSDCIGPLVERRC